MAKLTTAGRNRIAGSNFALPGRRYPVEDRAHARNALARVSQFGSSEEQEEVRRKVHAKYPGIGKSVRKSPGGYVVNPTHSMHDLRRNPRETYDRGVAHQEYEKSATDRVQTRLAGGYVPNPAQNAAIHAKAAHPRMHALSLASATHLRNQGHITPEHHARIERHVNNAMMQMKQPAMAPGGDDAPAAPFGSFAPPSTAGYA